MISNVIIHLVNEMPIMVDLEQLPAGGDRNVRCTNVRAVDGKRPAFVHDRSSTFVFPMGMIRLIEAPAQVGASAQAEASAHDTPITDSAMALVPESIDATLPQLDEEPDEDLLARIRSV